MPYPDLNRLLADFVYATLSADTAILGLVGGTIPELGNSRIYWYYNADAFIDAGRPAYISYAQMTAGRERGGMTEPVYSFRIYAYDVDLCFQIEARLNELFDKKRLAFTGLNGLPSQCVHAQDLYDQSNKFAGREVHYQFGALTTAR